jgi:hypothetical protein
MKKSSFIAAAVLSVTLLATFMLSIVSAPWRGIPGPDELTDCDHHGIYGSPNDTFTGVGIKGYYGYAPPAYVRGEWNFERGYGGTYPASGNMLCYSSYLGSYWDPPHFVWDYRNNAWAYYQDYYEYAYMPRVPSITGMVHSTFYNPSNPNDWWYVSSYISMTAGYP